MRATSRDPLDLELQLEPPLLNPHTQYRPAVCIHGSVLLGVLKKIRHLLDLKVLCFQPDRNLPCWASQPRCLIVSLLFMPAR